MRNIGAHNLFEMTSNDSEKYINGEEINEDEQLGNINIGGDEGNDHDNVTEGSRVPERINDDEFEDEDVEDYNINDIDFANDEFSALNSALDELQGALDTLESRNDGIHQELLQLLQSNREMRTTLVEEISISNSTADLNEEDNTNLEDAISLSEIYSDAGEIDDVSELLNMSKLDINCSLPPESSEVSNTTENLDQKASASSGTKSTKLGDADNNDKNSNV